MNISIQLTDAEHLELKEKAVKRVVQKLYEELIMVQLDNPEELDCDDTTLALVRARNDKKKQCTSTHVLFTINFEPEWDSKPLEVLDKVTKALQKKWITSALFCLEQRSDKKPYRGIHAHCVFPRGTKAPSQIKNEMLNTFKDYVGNAKHLNYQWTDLKGKKNFVRYVLGKKKEAIKEGSLFATVDWREENKLEKYYVFGKDFDVEIAESS